ncbi:MAG: CoB--CoM heterodisulfide reductase iron-sulfur subunit B family protein [bacterium]
MKYAYYPGCTLSTKAKNLDGSAKKAVASLGIELRELSHWNCCGTTFPLVTDNLMPLLAPARVLANAEKEGSKLVTLCSFCYNVLKRTNTVLNQDLQNKEKIAQFLKDEGREYTGGTQVIHLLELLRDEVGFKNIKNKIKVDLTNLKVAPYYGCQLLRPAEELQLDDPENPQIIEDFLKSIGCEVIDSPYETECCGSYLSVCSEDVVIDCSYRILASAIKNGAEAISVSCPLCYFNLDQNQKKMREKISGFTEIPIFYFTELLEIALGIDSEVDRFDLHFVDPGPLLTSKNLS